MGLVAAALWAVLVYFTAARHEPWADEAHSWLLARDAGLVELWTRLMGYEGSPGLWQTLLHILIRLGLPYSAINFVPAALGFGAACLLLFRAPLPLWARAALPFTFFLAYQYAVIARSYALLPLLLCACAAARGAGARTALLIAMAAVSVHGFALSVAVWLWARPWRFAPVYVGALALLAWSAWPPADGVFVTRPNLSAVHFVQTAGRHFVSAFTGEPVTTALVLGLSAPLLWRGGSLGLFAACAAALTAIAGLLYSQVWHHGLLFLAWLFAMWVAAAGRRVDRYAAAALVLVIAPQIWWTAASVRYDIARPYSAAPEAAGWLRERSIAGGGLYAVGYACTGLQPFFDRNIFANVNGGSPRAIWDWSARNRVNRDSERLAESRPPYVLIGYKNAYEHGVWRANVESAGYRLVRRFDAWTFWKTEPFEPESFDLYRRGDQ